MLIRNKLILRFTLLVLAIQLSFSAFVYYFHAAARQQRFSHRLAGKAIMTARLNLGGAASPADSNAAPARAFRRRDLLTIEQEEISIYAPDNRLLYVSDDTVSQMENLRQLALEPAAGGVPVRFLSGPLEAVALTYGPAGRTYRLFAAGYDELGRAQLASLRLILLAGNVGALVLIILAGWYFADESLKPIARVVKQVKRITARDLSRRVDEGNGTDEIAQLAITFNRMLGGVEQAFEAQKSFVGHASHELRTPLTAALGGGQGQHGFRRGRFAPPRGPDQRPAGPGPSRRSRLPPRNRAPGRVPHPSLGPMPGPLPRPDAAAAIRRGAGPARRPVCGDRQRAVAHQRSAQPAG